MAQTLTIDINKLHKSANDAITRTYYYLAFGRQIASDESLKKLTLKDVSHVLFEPQKTGAADLEVLKQDFYTWVLASGIRELIEVYDSFVNRVYIAALLIKRNKVGLSREDRREWNRFINNIGFEKKLQILQDEFSLSPLKKDCLISIYMARSALSHNRGFVQSRQCNVHDELHVCWLGIDFIMPDRHGKEIVISRQLEEPIQSAGGTLRAKLADRARAFRKGSKIDFELHELTEICFFIHAEVRHMIETLLEYGKAEGVNIDTRGGIPPPHSIEAESE